MDRTQFQHFIHKCQTLEGTAPSGCTILRDTQTDQMVLMRQIEIYSNEQFKTKRDALLKQKELYHDHLLSLIDFYASPDLDTIVAFYEYSTHTLIQEIQVRQQDQNAFTGEQLENILVSALKALDYLEVESTGHGCMSPADICLAEGVVKIVDPSIASASPLSIHEGYYYSPELLVQICHQDEQQIDIFKNDIFCLALCILHCGLLESCEDCFDYENGTIDFEVLEAKVQLFHQKYGERLVKILLFMLDQNADTRYLPKQLFEFIEAEFQSEAQDEEEEVEMVREFMQQSRQSNNSRAHDFSSSLSRGHILSSYASQNSSKQWSELLESQMSRGYNTTRQKQGMIQNPILQIKRERRIQQLNPQNVDYPVEQNPTMFMKPNKKPLPLVKNNSNKQNGWVVR